jgi:hypothetical protein
MPAFELLKSKEEFECKRSAWDEFRRDDRLRRMHNTSQEEMNVLALDRGAGRSRHAARLYPTRFNDE